MEIRGADGIVASYRAPKGPGMLARVEKMAAGIRADQGKDTRRRRGEVLDVDESGESARIRIHYPADHIPPRLSVVLAVVLGQIAWDGAIRLEDLRLPEHFFRELSGPRYGVPGIRERLAAPDRPLIMSVVRSEPGTGPLHWTDALFEQWMGGADLLTDDETVAHSGLLAEARVDRAREAALRIERECGRRPLYAVGLNASDPNMPGEAARLIRAGAEALLLRPSAMGLDSLAAVARLSPAPIVLAHPAVCETFTGAPGRTLAPGVAWGQLIRVAGADVGIYPSAFGGKTAGATRDVAVIARALTDPDPRRAVWPAPAARIHPGLLPALVREVGPHSVVNAGDAIYAHPAGLRSGAAAFRQALDRLLGRGGPVPDELAQALARWGGAA